MALRAMLAAQMLGPKCRASAEESENDPLYQGSLLRRELKQRLGDYPGYEVVEWLCSDASNEYLLLRLIHVMNSIFLDPSNEFLTQAVNIGIPKQTLGFCFHEYHGGRLIGGCRCLCQLPRHDRGWHEYKKLITSGPWSVSMQLQGRYRKLNSWYEVFTKFFSFRHEYFKEWPRTGVEFVMNN